MPSLLPHTKDVCDKQRSQTSGIDSVWRFFLLKQKILSKKLPELIDFHKGHMAMRCHRDDASSKLVRFSGASHLFAALHLSMAS